MSRYTSHEVEMMSVRFVYLLMYLFRLVQTQLHSPTPVDTKTTAFVALLDVSLVPTTKFSSSLTLLQPSNGALSMSKPLL